MTYVLVKLSGVQQKQQITTVISWPLWWYCWTAVSNVVILLHLPRLTAKNLIVSAFCTRNWYVRFFWFFFFTEKDLRDFIGESLRPFVYSDAFSQSITIWLVIPASCCQAAFHLLLVLIFLFSPQTLSFPWYLVSVDTHGLIRELWFKRLLSRLNGGVEEEYTPFGLSLSGSATDVRTR